MKQADVKIDEEYLIYINGKLCRVKVTGRRTESRWPRVRTLFDWVRVNPPANAVKLKGSDTAASLRPVREINVGALGSLDKVERQEEKALLPADCETCGGGGFMRDDDRPYGYRKCLDCNGSGRAD